MRPWTSARRCAVRSEGIIEARPAEGRAVLAGQRDSVDKRQDELDIP